MHADSLLIEGLQALVPHYCSPNKLTVELVAEFFSAVSASARPVLRLVVGLAWAASPLALQEGSARMGLTGTKPSKVFVANTNQQFLPVVASNCLYLNAVSMWRIFRRLIYAPLRNDQP